MTYSAAGNERKFREVTQWIMEEHPDYLFGKITMADQYIEQGTTDKIPGLLGHDLELRSLYPDRDIFHFVEILSYNRTVANYFLACDEPEKARERIEIMEHIDSDDEKTIDARKSLMKYNFESTQRKFEEDAKIKRSVTSRSYDKSAQTDRSPVFTHPEIEKLYNSGIDIRHQVLRNILALPRETLIRDLETVLYDSIHRYEYFRNKYEDTGWVDKEQNFNLHALLLLGELKSESSLPVVLHLLRQGEKLLEYWYGEFLTRVAAFTLFRIGKHDLETLKSFLREPDNYMLARLSVTRAIKMIGENCPDRRNEVIMIYEDLFRFVLDNPEDDRIIDTELISFWVWDCTDLKTTELTELIKELYRNQLVLGTICGTKDEVIREINSGMSSQEVMQAENLFDVYHSLNPEIEAELSKGMTEFYKNMMDERTSDDMFSGVGAPIDELPDGDFISPNEHDDMVFPEKDPYSKVGRNDPCPCGSGKKFKKCCME